MIEFIHSTPRKLRSHYRRLIGNFKLLMLSPKQHGKDGWRFGILVGDVCHVLPKQFKNRDACRPIAEARFGVKASEYRPTKRSVKPKLAEAA